MNTNKISKELQTALEKVSLPNNSDLSDLGNEIGICLGKYISEKMGFEIESFISGFKHGVSLAKGTH